MGLAGSRNPVCEECLTLIKPFGGKRWFMKNFVKPTEDMEDEKEG